MKYKLKIGPAVIHIEADSVPHDAAEPESLYWRFLTDGQAAPTLDLRLLRDGLPPRRSEQPLGQVTNHWELYRHGDGYRLEVIEQTALKPKQIAIFDSTWRTADVYQMPPAYDAPPELASGWVLIDLMEPLIQWWLTTWLALHGSGVILHGSGVAFGDQAMAFIGESGAGKSTLAGLCRDHGEARVLNDERIVVWRDDHRWRAAGTPWHGELRAATAPAAALTRFGILRKADHEAFVPIPASRLLAETLAQTFVPLWNPSAMENVVNRLLQLFDEVPSGEFHFRKGAGAAAFLAERAQGKLPAGVL
ncbi:MAG TPA: hypothetical protein VMU17_04225 [Elusimicrobiota bacterium]|nr:hypothetical protein [Elusimicrobiota bacterium]